MGPAAWLIIAQQQRGGSAHICFTYEVATEFSYGATAGWSYAGTLDTTFSYAGEC